MIKNISVGLAGFPLIMSNFVKANTQAWYDEGQTNWPNEADYPYDGYTLLVQFDLKDTGAVAVCFSETSDTITDNFDTELNYICMGLRYNSSFDEPVRQRYTDNISSSLTFNYESAASSTPFYAQANQYFDVNCGESTGLNYVGSGLSQCFGILTDDYLDNDGFVRVTGYLYLPE